ncbi:hypothetical protein BABA_03764 [Neobacillus bataviensis LMG 21833]|uniref:Uncharacterized protein n=1 Tax=Neobacillus bataviensis LMG 21833 TaxID=1117379 RepID=K6DRT0_9BACI|nr:hypothetical protein [Neobacillus bataviensis]EKN70948.1 hypothetical protein BABA_03764 [Neobacillus bataviensis LMG 21833]
MNDKKKEKLQFSEIILMILTLVASFVLFFLGYYSVAFVLFGIFMAITSFISKWTGTKNADYVYRKIQKNYDKW